jgi:N6-adenosine-specific RNA methylase IME4
MHYHDITDAPPHRYTVIYADPAWTFQTRSKKGKGRSPEMHYKCMTLDEIKALPVGHLAADDCALFLWVTRTHERQAHEVLDAWGFNFKSTAFTWVKLNKKATPPFEVEDMKELERKFFMGMGYGTRANPERCILATRGNPKRIEKGVRELILAPLREHSRKPDETYGLIDRLFDGPRIELFARTSASGFDTWGNQHDKFGRVYSVSQEETVDRRLLQAG